MDRAACGTIAAFLLAAALAFAGEGDKKPTTQPAGKTGKTPPASDLEYWLSRAKPATSQPATKPQAGRGPFRGADTFTRPDALPGVMELSDGTLLAGGLFTTRDQPWLVWIAQTKRWRRIPFITVLSITAVVVEEKMEQEWRWKAMGVPERVYTGREYPTRRMLWKFHLIDDSYLTGAIKGQPLSVELGEKTTPPMVLHERSKGKMDQKLKDLVYVKRAIVSRRMMEKVRDHLAEEGKKPDRKKD